MQMLPPTKQLFLSYEDIHEASREIREEDISLASLKDERKKLGLCQECGDAGSWHVMALFCRNGHGRFVG